MRPSDVLSRGTWIQRRRFVKLDAAGVWIEDGLHWHDRIDATPIGGLINCGMCMLGAITYAHRHGLISSKMRYDIWERLEMMSRDEGFGGSPTRWNDFPGRTLDEVMDRLQRAERKAYGWGDNADASE